MAIRNTFFLGITARGANLLPTVGGALSIPFRTRIHPLRPLGLQISAVQQRAVSNNVRRRVPSESLIHSNMSPMPGISCIAPLRARTPSDIRRFAAMPAASFSTTLLPSPWRQRESNTFTKVLDMQKRNFGTNGISQSILASREASANRNPQSATAQNAFYQVLLKANMPGIIVERYQSGRYATNEAVDEAYHKALAMLNPAGSVGVDASSAAFSPAVGSHSPAQLQAIGQAIAARSRGGNIGVGVIPPGTQATGGREGALHVVVDESYGSIIFRWFKFFFWFGLATYLSLILLSMMIEGMSVVRRTTKGPETEVKPEAQVAKFSDVHGCDEAKEELQELVEFLKNPDRFSALGGKLPKGVLLVGPPGTGKTLLARAVAGEAGVPFFYMSGSAFDEVYVGVGAKRVRDLFDAARSKAPAIVFIDELDAVGGKRNTRDVSYIRQTLNQLLTELDGFDQNSGVVIVGATNFPESLDPALIRPGRFDRKVTVPLPDVRGRIDILKHHAKKIKASPDVNLEAIGRTTAGLSGADLENIVNQAAVHASRRKASAVNTEDFDWAKDKVIMGVEKRMMVITPHEKQMTAYHEAGHALVSYFNPHTSKSLYKVTILPRGVSLGHTAFISEMDKASMAAAEYKAKMDSTLAGKIAEEIVYGNDNVTSGCSSDLSAATDIAFNLVARLGMSDRAGNMDFSRVYSQLSSETRAMVEDEVRRTLAESYERARKLLLSRRKELDLLAKALVEFETLNREEVEKVMRGEALPGRIAMPDDSVLMVTWPGTPPTIEMPGQWPPLPPPGGAVPPSTVPGAGPGEGDAGAPPPPPPPPPPAAGI